MRYERSNLLEQLAGEYVLGTLTGPARRRFAAVVRAHIAARRAVRDWEARLAPLALSLRPVQPPADLWPQIRGRLGFAPATRRPRALWPALAASVTLLVGGLAGWLLSQWLVSPVPAYVAVVAEAADAPVWLIEGYPRRRELRVRTLGRPSLPADQAYELWMLPDDGSAPVSLGLLPLVGERALPLRETQAKRLAGASVIAVSLEPAGGSPSGAPTGPVLFTAPLVRS